ncbi:serine hydrolase [Runella sp. MFBS21]|uniref:serine hydrolase domain-containing protein n=1 Tax=Runella sp. MFBS21 TaxID=3034018 RepID=UPI0023F8617A|nr:serine hydrolase domain-containing protein [Runella sp. MFBS21]MDF7821546.1 serine hydrolase [Runella sp. MFBS21]
MKQVFLIFILLAGMWGCGIFDYPESTPISELPPSRIDDPLKENPTKPDTSIIIPKDPTDTGSKDTIKVPPTKPDTTKKPDNPTPPPTLYQKLDNFIRNNSSNYDNNIMVFIHNGDSLVYSYKQGIYSEDNALRIASSSKWLTAAVIMSLVDEKKLKLDDKIGGYLPIFSKYGKGDITIRQLFGHTSGIITDSPFDERDNITLEAAVDSIAIYTQLLFPPGKAVLYGSTAYKIAARIAEVVEAKTWKTIFEERIANKCEMKNVVFNPNAPMNPHAGAGAVCSLNEYVKFLAMIHAKGVYKGTRVLSEASINEMEKDQTGSMNRLYGLGLWRYNYSSGTAIEVSSPSALGVHPWVNRNKGYFGIIFTQAGFDKTYQSNLAFRELVQNNL